MALPTAILPFDSNSFCDGSRHPFGMAAATPLEGTAGPATYGDMPEMDAPTC